MDQVVRYGDQDHVGAGRDLVGGQHRYMGKEPGGAFT
jgi:hypothetical protein